MADQGIKCIPEWVNELNKINDIVSVHFVENTGPYRKIFPALINSADDD
nr:glycosyltransferase family 2 protein [Klebsiella variicola]